MMQSNCQESQNQGNAEQPCDKIEHNELNEDGIHCRYSCLRKSRRITGKTLIINEDDASLKPNSKRGTKYAQIPQERRMMLVNEVLKTGCTIKSAAKRLEINFSTAKAIMQTYRREGRIGKKEIRKQRRRKCTFGLYIKKNQNFKGNQPPVSASPKLRPDKVEDQQPINDSQPKSRNMEIPIKLEFDPKSIAPQNEGQLGQNPEFDQPKEKEKIDQLVPSKYGNELIAMIHELQKQKLMLQTHLQLSQNELCRQKQINQQIMLQLSQCQRGNQIQDPSQFSMGQAYFNNFQKPYLFNQFLQNQVANQNQYQ